MHKAPLVTVITVTFNARAALERTIRSVANQDYPRLEYIVIDGGSTDGTLETIKENEGNITQWVSESDQGIYDAMNKGVRMAHGEYCIFMNAGDTFVTPHTVSDFFSQLYAPADVAYGDIIKNGILKPALPPRNCHKMYYCHQAVFTRTDCLRQYPFDTAHRYSADFKQSKQLFLAGKKFVHIPLPVADFDTHGVSNVHRSAGLWDNIRVVCETDRFADRCRFLPHLLLPWMMCKLRGK